MSEGEHGAQFLAVGPAIAHIDAFLVFLVDDVALGLGSALLSPGSGIGVEGMGAHILQRLHPGEGKLA